MIEDSRIRHLNSSPVKSGEYVLYWMQQSQRAECNHALEFAIERANEQRLGLVVYFGLTDAFPDANERHYRFMLEGLREVHDALSRRGICMVVERSAPEVGVVSFSSKASLVVCDRGYLRIQRAWREYVAARIECPLIQIESDAVVPVETASDKEEYSAATLRPKLHRVLQRYLVDLEEGFPVVDSAGWKFDSCDLSDPSGVVLGLAIDRSVAASSLYHGGAAEANRRLDEFVLRKLDRYDDSRNDPNEDGLSNLSPYLHFGQISPIRVAIEITRRGSTGLRAFLEELIVRRELSMNFVHYNPQYDSFSGLPNWARQTLSKHQHDAKEYKYTRDELEQARTHDEYWNAAQMQMVLTGKMHGYMRMYWGKKILEWTATPQGAYDIALNLNNKYEIDGRDPNGFSGVAWCFGKHDRPWGERSVFGNVRYMNANGLKRKFDADSYARRYSRSTPASTDNRA
jgi:deoxyribodipyrimidine photo-lyase